MLPPPRSPGSLGHGRRKRHRCPSCPVPAHSWRAANEAHAPLGRRLLPSRASGRLCSRFDAGDAIRRWQGVGAALPSPSPSRAHPPAPAFFLTAWVACFDRPRPFVRCCSEVFSPAQLCRPVGHDASWAPCICPRWTARTWSTPWQRSVGRRPDAFRAARMYLPQPGRHLRLLPTMKLPRARGDLRQAACAVISSPEPNPHGRTAASAIRGQGRSCPAIRKERRAAPAPRALPQGHRRLARSLPTPRSCSQSSRVVQGSPAVLRLSRSIALIPARDASPLTACLTDGPPKGGACQASSKASSWAGLLSYWFQADKEDRAAPAGRWEAEKAPQGSGTGTPAIIARRPGGTAIPWTEEPHRAAPAGCPSCRQPIGRSHHAAQGREN